MNALYYSNPRSRGLQKIDQNKNGAWLHVVAPDQASLEALEADYGLDIDLLTDAMDLYEAPRIERSNGAVYIFTRYYYADNGVINATEPLLIVYAPNMLVTLLRVKSPILTPLIEGSEKLITSQKTRTMLQILEAVNNSYTAYLTQATRTILSARSQLKKTGITNEALLAFVEMEDDLNEFISALEPQAAVLRNLLGKKYIKLYEEDRDLIEDLTLNTSELIQLVQSRLKTIVTVREAYDSIAASELNSTFRKLTSISIFLTVPTITTGLYGMNLRLPLSHNPYAFWYILLVVMGITVGAIMFFKRMRWL